MSLIAREMANQPNGEAQKQPQLTSGLSNEHLALDHRGNTQLAGEIERNYNPPPSSFSKPKQTTGSNLGANGLADFFSQEVFRIVLHNPTTAHRLLKFSQARMCGENMEFLEKVRLGPCFIT